MTWFVAFFFLAGAFVLQGLRKIPAQPPHIGAVTILGRRTGGIRKEGWTFLPLYPWLYGVILVDVTKKNFDVKPADVRTSTDMANIEVSMSITFTPDREQAIEYLNAGGEAGVRSILEDIAGEAVREFAADTERKPNTWEEAVKMKREFLAEVVAIIIGRDPRDPEDQAYVATITPELRRGNGALKIETLGVILNRVNVTKIQPADLKLAEAATKEAVEKREQKAETVELAHIRDRVKELTAPLNEGGLGLTAEQALEVIQTERGKVTKNVAETKLNLSPETRAMIEKILPDILSRITKPVVR